MRPGLLAASIALSLLGAVAAFMRIDHHAERELVAVGQPASLASDGGPVELVTAPLLAGQYVVFEVCAGDGFAASRWRDAAAFEVRELGANAVVVTSLLDAARLATVRRDASAGCVTVASAAALGVDGRYAIFGAATQPDGALAAVPIVGRVVATMPLSERDFEPLLLLFLAGLCLVALFAFSSAPAVTPAEGRLAWLGRAAVAFSFVGAVLLAVGWLPLPPPYASLLGASLIGGAQLTAALTLAGPRGTAPGSGLAIGLPRGRARWLAAAAPFLGVALVILGRYVSALIPSTSVAPIETFVASGSGYLTVAASGLLLPIFEELFFRGLLFGLVERAAGPLVAVAVVALAFPLMHLPQVYGAWGALASLFVTGLALTVLRAASGSVAPSMLAHVVHNGLITLLGFPLAGA